MVKKVYIALAISVFINIVSCNRASNASVKSANDSANNQIAVSAPTRVIEVSEGKDFLLNRDKEYFRMFYRLTTGPLM